MNHSYILYHLVRADFLERIRRYSFLVTLGLTVYVGYTFVPPVDANYVTVAFGSFRGVYTSAWIGTMVAILATVFLPLPGFYLVKNALERDRRTGVGQVIATTPMSGPLYILGKALSNFAVLAVIAGILALAAVVMQLVRGEESRVDLIALLTPILLIVTPAMALVAALAVFFETVRWLRGGFGNVVYVMVWLGLILFAAAPSMANRSGGTGISDPLGVSQPLASMARACKAAFPDWNGSIDLGYAMRTETTPFQTFQWAGMEWTAGLVLGRLLWIAISIGVLLFAAVLFDRFDPAAERKRTRREKDADEAESLAQVPSIAPSRDSHLTPLNDSARRFRFRDALLAELRLMLKGVSRWWYLVAGGLIIASLFAPIDAARHGLLPAALIWPLLIWSGMGSREDRHNTKQLVFSAPYIIRRQLPALWVAGVVLGLALSVGVATRLAFGGDWSAAAAALIGAAFVPSLALALGIWSGSSKLFEVLFVLLWYVGPINQVPALDFAGISNKAVEMGMPLVFLAVSIALCGLTVLGRMKQLRT